MAFDFKSARPRLRKGDQLFQSDLSDLTGNVRLGSSPDAYTLGYRRAAEHLVQDILVNQREGDYLVYPIVFLYRHHIELAIKRIIACVPWVLRRELTVHEKSHLTKDHRLEILWDDLEPIFASICEAVNWSKPDAADLQGVRDYIRQLSEVDPSSLSFRYWKTTDGKRSLPEDFRSFNIRHFSEMMGHFADFIEALDAATTAAGEMRDDFDDAFSVDELY
jgi:hypothetical protein